MKTKSVNARVITSRALTRRRFLAQTTAAASAVFAAPAILKSAAPNGMLQVACIGVGGMGGSTMKGVADHAKVKVVAMCDVDNRTLQTASKVHPEAALHRDWREMLANPDRFDAVTIGTPDHMHAAPAVIAIRAKKHIYLQKPMAATLHECRVITEEARKAGVITQLGNQGRSSIESRMAVELLRSGAIGKIKEVILWENKPLSWWPENTELRAKADPIPAGFDWDMWLGVREPRPYLEKTYHPKTWRAWFDFGVGEMGDMGCHHFDTSFDALKLTAPLRVRQTTPGSSGPLWGERRTVELVFPGSDITADKTVKLTWHDGTQRPDASQISLPGNVKELPAQGTYWIGETGTMFKKYGASKPVVLPEANFPASKYPQLEPQDHYHDWVNAILEGHKACDDFAHGGPMTEAVLVGAMADRFAGQWLEWDATHQQFKGNEQATTLVRRKYRDGWHVPGLG